MRLLAGGREIVVYDAAFGDRRHDAPSCRDPIVTRASDCTVMELSELIFKAVFNPNENEWTKVDCWERCDEVACNVLLDSERALRDTVRAAIGRRLETLVPEGKTATMIVVGSESTKVTITDGAQ